MAYAATIRATHRSARILGTFEVDGTLNAAVLKVAGLTMLGGALTTYTQTYATAAATVPAATTHAITDSSGGTPSTTAIAAIGGTYNQAEVRNAVATLAAEAELTKADIVAVKKLVNQIIDDLQLQGLAL